MNKPVFTFFILVAFCTTAGAQKKCCAEAIAATIVQNRNDSSLTGSFADEQGIILEGMIALWKQTGDKVYFNYVQKAIDNFIDENGNIKSYEQEDHNIDHIKNAATVLWLYRVTGKEKYWKAATALREQIKKQSQIKAGINDLMALPFYTTYAILAHEDIIFDDIANRLIQAEQHIGDSKTGLLQQGWYMMTLADVLENFPPTHPKQKELVAILNRTVDVIEKVQDKNYSGTLTGSMFVYAVAKAARLGYLPEQNIPIAQKIYKGIKNNFIKTGNGFSRINDPKELGAFLKASTEMELLPTLKLGAGKTILLDYYFNHETTKDITGTTIQHHYTWEELSNGGYSFLGDIFKSYAVQIKKLAEPVSAANLKDADIYFIIDPDWPKENKTPNYIEEKHIEAIYNWVKEGGVLMLFANDSNNVEFKNYNRLAEKFGIHFNENNPRNLVKDDYFPAGTISIPPGHSIFKTAKNIYIKDISSLSLQAPAKAVLTDKGDNIIAVSKVGKGTVFAIGDPWLYNEYLDGRKLPSTLENFKAAHDLVQWLIKQTR